MSEKNNEFKKLSIMIDKIGEETDLLLEHGFDFMKTFKEDFAECSYDELLKLFASIAKVAHKAQKATTLFGTMKNFIDIFLGMEELVNPDLQKKHDEKDGKLSQQLTKEEEEAGSDEKSINAIMELISKKNKVN